MRVSTPSRELLIVSPERWDEACFSVPAVRALAGSGLGIGVLCQAHQKAFWETLPGLTVHTPRTLQDPWQVALIWEPGELVKVVRKAGIHKRIGPACGPQAGGRSGKLGKLTKQLTETLKEGPHPNEHRVQFYLKAVIEMGAPTAKPEFFKPAQLEVHKQEDTVLLVPGSDFGPSYEWRMEGWKQLADELRKNHALSIGRIEGGRNMGEQLAHHLGDNIPVGTIHLREPQLDLIASHSRVIAADGSLPHLASHLGSTCITLYGPNDPNWKRPLGKRHQVVRRHVECAPCFTYRCPLDKRCQKELEVKHVLDAIQAVAIWK